MLYIELWRTLLYAEVSSCLKLRYPSNVSARRVSRYTGTDVSHLARNLSVGCLDSNSKDRQSCRVITFCRAHKSDRYAAF